MFGSRQLARRLGFEWLEGRELLAGSAIFHHAAAAFENAIQKTFTAPDGEDALLKVVVNVGMPAFHDFAESTGELQVPDNQQYGNLELKDGQSATFSMRLKSLDEYFKQWPGFREANEEYLLYFTQVEITETKFIPGRQPEFKVHQWDLARFITALDPHVFETHRIAGWQSDLIPFESTAYDTRIPASSGANYKTVQVIAPSRHTPALFAYGTTSNQAAAFRNVVGTNGENYIEFVPQAAPAAPVEPGGVVGKIEILRGIDPVGTIRLAGKVVTPRTWWIDLGVYEAALEQSFPFAVATGLKLADPNVFRDLARDIVSDIETQFDGFWKNNAIGPSQGATAANATITINVGLEPGNPNPNAHTVLHFGVDPSFAAFRLMGTLKHQAPHLNTVTTSYLFGEALDELRSHNPGPPIYTGKLPTYYTTAFARRSEAKALAHELGHAHLFVGHIIPAATDGAHHPHFDLMQSGQDLGSLPFRVVESAPYLYLALGRGWSAGANVEAALDRLALDNAPLPAPGQRVHDIFEADVYDWPWVRIEDAKVVEGDFGSTFAEFAVRLSYPTDKDVGVGYFTAGGTASGGTDFGPVSGTLVIPAGQVHATISVPVLSDFQAEFDETFSVVIMNANQAVLQRSVAQGLILDDDSPFRRADFNGNGMVGGDDFLTWQRGFGSSATQYAAGDADLDNDVDGDDLEVWRAQFGISGLFDGPLDAHLTAVSGVGKLNAPATSGSAGDGASLALAADAWLALPAATSDKPLRPSWRPPARQVIIAPLEARDAAFSERSAEPTGWRLPGPMTSAGVVDKPMESAVYHGRLAGSVWDEVATSIANRS